MKRTAATELKRAPTAAVKVKHAAAATAEEDTDEQAYFNRIGTFQDRNREFVQTAASAVGAEENGHMAFSRRDTPGRELGGKGRANAQARVLSQRARGVPGRSTRYPEAYGEGAPPVTGYLAPQPTRASPAA